MSTFNYHKPGIGNASSYLVSGLPFITSSTAPALNETSVVVNFPRVTNYVVIKNTNTADVGLRVTFNKDSVVDNTDYFVLDRGESYSGDLRTTDVHLMSDGATPVPFTVIAGLTNIDRGEMTQNVPKPPNLLAWAQKQKLVASDSEAGDWLAENTTISSDGKILVVGAKTSSPDGLSNAGSVYVFQNGSEGYQEVQKLTSSDIEVGDYFGSPAQLSLDGKILAVAATLEDPTGVFAAGSVYIFQSGSSGYQEIQKLTGSDLGSSRAFGENISMNSDGKVLAIGVQYDDPAGLVDAGSVYIFASGSGGYQQVQKLTASDATAGDRFGNITSMTADGKILAVGAYLEDPAGLVDAGSVYIFASGSGGYQEAQKLTASFGTDGLPEVSPQGDQFGLSVTFSATGETLAVGAWADEENGTFAGAVYIFQSGSTGYQQIDKLIASGDADPSYDAFGASLACTTDGNTLIVGAIFDEEGGGGNSYDGAGSVYVFRYTRDY